MPFKFFSNRSAKTTQFGQWHARIEIAGLFLVLLYTLFPYDFSLISNFSVQAALRQLSEDSISGLKDVIELILNLVLFGIFSFGCVGVLQQHGLNRVSRLIFILLICLTLGIVTELMQTILPGRNVNGGDVLSSGAGGAVGWVLYEQWHLPIFYTVSNLGQRLHRYLSPRTVVIAFIGYFVFSTIVMVLLPTATDFRNWDDSYPLILGNEGEGNRPWQGTIAQVRFFDQALASDAIAHLFTDDSSPNAQASLVASYDFRQPQQLNRDQTGHLPALVWSQPKPPLANQNGVKLGADHWLQTPTAARYLNQQIQKNNAFTLSLMAQPENLTQSGPARIVSLSQNNLRRNFTLGQAAKDLVIRLRTPITGKNGSNPPMIIPQVFKDTRAQHLVVTYRDSRLQVYVNNVQTLHVFRLPHWGYQLLYYGWVFMPLGGLLALLLTRIRSSRLGFIILLLVCVGLPPVFLEAALCIVDRRSFALENVGMNWGLMLGMLVLTQSFIQSWFKHRLNHD